MNLEGNRRWVAQKFFLVPWPFVKSRFHCSFLFSSRSFWNTIMNIPYLSQGLHSHILMTGGGPKDFFGSDIWAKRDFFGSMWKTPGFFGVAKTTEGFFGVLYFSSAQIKNNISAIYSFVFDQNQSWSWHVLAFQKINNKICWCKNTEGFFWVC